MAIFIISILILSIVFNGGLIILLYSHYKNTLLDKLLLLHLLGILLWSFAVLHVLESGSIFATHLAYFGAYLLALCKYYFIGHFITPEARIFSRFYWVEAMSFIILAITLVPGLVFEHSISYGYYVAIAPGPLAGIFMLSISYLLIQPIVVLIKARHNKRITGTKRKQINMIYYGLCFFFILGLLTNSVLPNIFNYHKLNGLGPAFSLFLAIFIFINIYRYNFLNLKLIIQRGLIFTVLLTFVVSLYAMSLSALSLIAHTQTNVTAFGAAVIATVTGIFTFPYVDTYLRRTTHRFFFKEPYDYSLIIYELSQCLNKSLFLPEIISETKQRLMVAFSAETIEITLQNEPKLSTSTLDTKTFIYFPLKTTTEEIGTLILGAKKSGDPYTKQDIQLLQTLSHQLAMSIERARLYQSVQDYSKELENKVHIRTKEVQALHAYQKQMLDEISHSLQTPLAIITNEIKLLDPDMTDKEHVISFQKSVSALSEFISSLLHLSSVESSDKLNRTQRVNLSALLSDVIEYSEISLGQIDVLFSSHIQSDIYITGDYRKLEEVCNILIHNALKYRKKDTQRIKITLKKHQETISLKFKDTGIGIPVDQLPHVFKRFYRVRDTTVSPTMGSGLGLAIAEAIIKKHDGTITVASKHHVYTEFTITLPANS